MLEQLLTSSTFQPSELLIQPGGSADRTFTFTNYCSDPVWFGFAGGSTQSKTGGTECTTDADCYTGSSCIAAGAVSFCFFNNPVPSNNDFKLVTGQSNSVSIPFYNVGSSVIWSGAMTGRTGCDENGENCAKADCGGASCKPSQGFAQPATQAEMTLQSNTVDFYDIEIINGVHMGVSMGPTNAQASTGGNPYSCGTPGALNPSDPMFGPASWDFTAPSDDYIWVQAGGQACESSTACPSGQYCGISFNPGHSELMQRTCGEFMGWWTADEICGVSPTFGEPFNCQTNWDQLACVGVGSCYQQGATTDCCGCANWWEEGIKCPASPYTQSCVNQNPNWTSTIQPMLQWLKEGCPNCYTYPYDDMSSTFTCQSNQAGVNSVNYEIAFCPEKISSSQAQE